MCKGEVGDDNMEMVKREMQINTRKMSNEKKDKLYKMILKKDRKILERLAKQETILIIDVFSIEDIFDLHNRLIKDIGGDYGTYDYTYGRISFIIDNLSQSFYGVELYPSIFKKSAMLLFFFAKDHCFQDGNKRVAWLTCRMLLAANGYEILDDGYDFASLVETVSALKGTEVDTEMIINDISNILLEHTCYNEDLLD